MEWPSIHVGSARYDITRLGKVHFVFNSIQFDTDKSIFSKNVSLALDKLESNAFFPSRFAQGKATVSESMRSVGSCILCLIFLLPTRHSPLATDAVSRTSTAYSIVSRMTTTRRCALLFVFFHRLPLRHRHWSLVAANRTSDNQYHQNSDAWIVDKQWKCTRDHLALNWVYRF